MISFGSETMQVETKIMTLQGPRFLRFDCSEDIMVFVKGDTRFES